jgi:rhodanese-related sulfurtransferase
MPADRFIASGSRIRAALAALVLGTVFSALAAAETPKVADVSQAQVVESLGKPGAPLLLDVRSEKEFAAGHVPGAINIPYDALPARLGELAKHRDAPVVVYCESGRRAGIASETLQGAGFSKLQHMSGDMSGWRSAGLPIEK